MTRPEIRLDTLSQVNKFVEAMSVLHEEVWLADDNGCRVSAKSLLGALYSMEWKHVYCYCNSDINAKLMPWMI